MFFDQIKEIDGNLKDLRDHLKNIGSAVDVHFDQLDDIAAHIIALEAVMVQVMKTLMWIWMPLGSGSVKIHLRVPVLMRAAPKPKRYWKILPSKPASGLWRWK